MELFSQHVEEGCEVKGTWGFSHHLVNVTIIDVSDTKGHVTKYFIRHWSKFGKKRAKFGHKWVASKSKEVN